MKMRASLSSAIVCSTAALCLAAIIVCLCVSHRAKTVMQLGAAGKSIQNSKVDSKWSEAYGKLPMGFEKNKGQTNSDVRFLARGQGYELFLTPQEAVVELRNSKSIDLSPLKRTATLRALHSGKDGASVVRMHMVGANPDAKIAGLDQLPGKTNYFVGDDSKNWRTDVPSYARVKYTGIYPGIDLVFYGNQRKLEYDYIVAPGADLRQIALHVTGASKLRIDTRGNLVMSVAGGEIELQKPIVYQDVNGGRQEIAGSYALSGNQQVEFAVADYDRNKPLIVDPVLNYSTYLGGSAAGDVAYGIAVDAAGDAYIAGQTFSLTFPTTSANALDSTPTAGIASGAAFVTELNPAGTAELYSTYLGGSGGEAAYAVAVDSSGFAYVTGFTGSIDFPTTANAYIPGPLATNPGGSAFISKINTSLNNINSLVYSSYVGGTNFDYGNGIAVDSSQNAFITGITRSPNISTTGAFQTAPTDSTDGNAFLTEIATSSSGSASLVYSTYLGGTGANAGNLGYADEGWGIAVGSGKAYIVGTTSSTDFPIVNGYQTGVTGGNVAGSVFVSVIDTTQSGSSSLFYSTYLSGEALDDGYAIALGQNGVAYATGTTNSLQFPITTGAFQTTGAASGVVFVSLIDTTKTGSASLKYSTFLGGSDSDTGQGIQVDSSGNAYVTGVTDSLGENIPAFPLTPGALQNVQYKYSGSRFCCGDQPER